MDLGDLNGNLLERGGIDDSETKCRKIRDHIEGVFVHYRNVELEEGRTEYLS